MQAVELGKDHAIGIPGDRAAQRVDQTHGVAAVLVVAESRLADFAAVACRRVTAGGGGFTVTCRVVPGQFGADFIPQLIRAIGIDRADRRAARLIVASGGPIGEATGTCAWITAFRSGTGVQQRTRVVLTIVVAGGLSLGGAVDVPLIGATEGVEQTHGITACGIIAPRCPVRTAAFACAGIAAFEFTVGALGALAGEEDAQFIPGALVAAEGVLVADGFTTRRIIAVGGLIRFAAGSGLEITAFGRITFGECHGTAIGIPGGLAAEGVDFTDLGTAFAFTASGADLRDEAAAGGGDSAARAATLFREKGAGAIPSVAAAERIDLTDGRTAGRIGTVRCVLRSQAASRTEVTAAGTSLADGVGDVDTGVVPLDLAAVRVVGFAVEVGVEDADRLAARLKLAARIVVSGEAVSAAGTDRVGGSITEFIRERDTRLTPLQIAAQRIEIADDVAAIGVLAAGASVRQGARTFAGADGEVEADVEREFSAVVIPFLGAAEFESGDRTDRRSARGHIASRGAVSCKAVAGVRGYAGLVALGQVQGGGDADRIPAHFATVGVEFEADDLAALGVRAASGDPRDEAVSGVAV